MSRKDKLRILYKKGSDQIEKDMDIVKIVRDIKQMKIFIKNKFFDKVTKFQLMHNRRNIIDLEDTSSCSSCGDDNNHDHNYQ